MSLIGLEICAVLLATAAFPVFWTRSKPTEQLETDEFPHLECWDGIATRRGVSCREAQEVEGDEVASRMTQSRRARACVFAPG